MYGIADDLEFSFLTGSSVSDVKEFDSSDARPSAKSYVIISLEPKREIHIEGGRRLDAPATTLKELIGHTITKIEIRSRTELALFFSEGSCLHLFDDSTEFECFHIEPEHIVV